MKFSHYLVTVGTAVIVFNTINSAVSQTLSSFQCNNSCFLLDSPWLPDSVPALAGGNKPIAISESSDFAQSSVPSSTPSASPKPLNSADIPSRRTSTPNNLNPNPNPLQFPTKPEEVRLEAAESISLEQALELARRNNRQLQVALLTLERSRASVREAQAEEYPTLSVQGGLNSRGSNVFSSNLNNSAGNGNNQLNQLLNQGSSRGSSTALNGTVELSYNVYTAGARTARIRSAEEQLRFDQLDVERITQQLRLDVSNDYYDLQQADEQVRINRGAVTNAEASLRDAQAREQAGVGTRFDVLQSQV